jgi:hypothetical protein
VHPPNKQRQHEEGAVDKKFCMLCDAPASEFYMRTFRNTLFHLHGRVGMKNSSYLPTYENGTDTYPPMKMEQCSETLAYKIQTPDNHPEGSMQHSEHGESLNQEKINFLIIVTAHFPTKHYKLRVHLLCLPTMKGWFCIDCNLLVLKICTNDYLY